MSEPTYAWEVADNYERRIQAAEDKVGSLAADLLEERTQRREVGEALVRVTEERDDLRRQLSDEQDSHAMTQSSFEIFMESMTEDRDGWKAAVDRLTEQGIQHGKRHQALFDEWLRERAQLIAERDKARDEVVRLGREGDEVRDENRRLRDQLRFADARIARDAAEFVRLRTIIGELRAAEAAEPLEPSITPSLPAAYDPERDQLVVLGGPGICDCFCHDCCVPLTDACEHCGDRHPQEGIEALRPEGKQP